MPLEEVRISIGVFPETGWLSRSNPFTGRISGSIRRLTLHARMLLFYFLQDGAYLFDIFRLERDDPLAHDGISEVTWYDSPVDNDNANKPAAKY